MGNWTASAVPVIPAGNFAIYDASPLDNYFSGYVGLGTTTPGEHLEASGNVRASGQVSTGAQVLSGAGDAVDWNGGNAISTDFDCTSPIAIANLRDGGAYTLVITGPGTTACTFDAVTSGTDAGALSCRFRPARTCPQGQLVAHLSS